MDHWDSSGNLSWWLGSNRAHEPFLQFGLVVHGSFEAANVDSLPHSKEAEGRNGGKEHPDGHEAADCLLHFFRCHVIKLVLEVVPYFIWILLVY